MEQVDLKIFADYHQVFPADEHDDGFSPEWSEKELENMAAASENTVILCPVRAMAVPVRVEIHAAEPSADLENWDHVVECSISSPTGRLSICGCTGAIEAWLTVEPGCYRIKMLYAGLDTLSNSGLDGNDCYQIVLWPGPCRPLQVVKRWTRKN